MSPRDDRLEDLAFLDSTGVGAHEAARRTGFPSAHAMEKWLSRHGRFDLWLSLKRRDPAGAHPSGTDRKKRLMSVTDQTDTIVALLAQGQKSTRARTRNRAAKIAEMVEDLRAAMTAEREEDRLKEAARKDVERLERELAEAKARLKGGPATVIDVGNGVSAAELRAWAQENGVECPERGRIPAAVREAFEDAQDDEQQAS